MNAIAAAIARVVTHDITFLTGTVTFLTGPAPFAEGQEAVFPSPLNGADKGFPWFSIDPPLLPVCDLNGRQSAIIKYSFSSKMAGLRMECSRSGGHLCSRE